MGFNIGKALHSLVGFAPIPRAPLKEVARMGMLQQHPQGPSREQIANFNKNLVDVNQRAGTPLPVQQGSISPANPDGTWLRRNLGLPVGQSFSRLSPAKYALPLNSDGTGGGFSDTPVMNGNTGIQTMNQPQQGFGQQVQGVGGYQVPLQAGRTSWQNTGGVRRNMVNPQVQDDGYYYF